jgi:hypothetical protein
MTKKNIEQIIREMFRQNFSLYPESYPLTTGPVNNQIKNEGGDLLVTDEAVINAQDVAKGYWSVRNEDEIERDERVGVTEIDYVDWVMAELSELIPAAK